MEPQLVMPARINWLDSIVSKLSCWSRILSTTSHCDFRERCGAAKFLSKHTASCLVFWRYTNTTTECYDIDARSVDKYREKVCLCGDTDNKPTNVTRSFTFLLRRVSVVWSSTHQVFNFSFYHFSFAPFLQNVLTITEGNYFVPIFFYL